jgi:hypothetical protein
MPGGSWRKFFTYFLSAIFSVEQRRTENAGQKIREKDFGISPLDRRLPDSNRFAGMGAERWRMEITP